ncbi:uncharacterized protein LOC117200901 isoform X1 [Orcinus orca]|uniref:uncharacterized protein LOC117200901 isoform X1 n=1 Tax=Orcinus orca TaxID=9733 RepID=UPI002111DCF0|nr:uncharacterized protein LOC117200901 isoform X1 [Orcinus orca]XP_049555273.1 uncharacterized protein LOC117200901 isoform X1 [Orcinus orca]
MLPLFEGDDLRRLAQEITKARSFLWQAQSFRCALQAAPPTCLVASAHPDPGPRSGPNSRRKTSQNRRLLRFRKVFSGATQTHHQPLLEEEETSEPHRHPPPLLI